MSKIIDRYEKNLNLRKEGKYPGIPMHEIFKKLSKYMPSWPPETMGIIFGPTGSGKTQLYKAICLRIALRHHQGLSNIKPLFIVNLLEESIEEFEDSLVSMLYYLMFEKEILSNLDIDTTRITKLKLNSYTEKYLTDLEVERLKTIVIPKTIEIIKEYFVLSDKTYHAFGLYEIARKKSREIGTHWYTKLKKEYTIPDLEYKDWIKLSDTEKKKYKWSKYVLHDSNVIPFVITDHIARISPKKGQDEKEALKEWSFDYCRKNISKNWKWIVINIMQTTVYSESKTYSYKNEINLEALKPTLADIGGSKEVAQDVHFVISLFNPSRYINEGYVNDINMEEVNGRIRILRILKNRIGEDQAELGMYFDGATANWKEIALSKKEDTFYTLNSRGKGFMKLYDICKM